MVYRILICLFLITGSLRATVLKSIHGWQEPNRYFGAEYSSFLVHNPDPARTVNGLFEELRDLQGNYLGGNLSFRLSRSGMFSAGIGLSRISFLKETQGVFPETNEYGLAVVKGINDRWSFPFSFSWHNILYPVRRGPKGYKPHRNNFSSGLRITYTPSFQGAVSSSIQTFGGAITSSYASSYVNNMQSFQHSLLFSISNQFYNGSRSILLNIDPFIGIGSGYFTADKAVINTVNYGVSISLHFRIPSITIEKQVQRDPNADEMKKLLEKKQQEIKEQLNKKPNN